MYLHASMWDPFCGVKKHMGFFLRQYPWPLATWLGAKKEIVCKPKVLTHGFLVKKEGGWGDLKNMPEIHYFFVYQYRLNAP